MQIPPPYVRLRLDRGLREGSAGSVPSRCCSSCPYHNNVGLRGLNANNRVQATGLVVSNLNLDFGTVVVGSSKVVSENILNTTSSSVTISQVVVTGSSFQLDGGSFPLTLASNQSATIAIRFVPQNSGKPSGSLAISSTASAPISVALAGQSVNAGQLSVNPSPISFGNVMLGGSQTRSATLTNSGGSDLTISEVAVSGNGFQVSGMNLPFTLPANQSTNFSVTFTPKSSGNQSGTISVTTSASLVASSRNGKPSSLCNRQCFVPDQSIVCFSARLGKCQSADRDDSVDWSRSHARSVESDAIRRKLRERAGGEQPDSFRDTD